MAELRIDWAMIAEVFKLYLMRSVICIVVVSEFVNISC